MAPILFPAFYLAISFLLDMHFSAYTLADNCFSH